MKTLILSAIVCVALLVAAGAEASRVIPQMGFGYDLRWVLCCGRTLEGKPFCTNLMKDECETYYGRVVGSCSECWEAPKYSPWPDSGDGQGGATGK